MKRENILKIIFGVCLSLSSSPLFAELKDLFFVVNGGYSIRTPHQDGSMMKNGFLNKGQVIKISNVDTNDLVYKDDGSLNQEETLHKIKERKKIIPRTYGNGDNKEVFFPVTVYNSDGTEKELEKPGSIALLYAESKGTLEHITKSQLNSNILLSISQRGRMKYVDYGVLSNGDKDCMNPLFSFDLPNYFQNYSLRPVQQCTEDTISNGAWCLYPDAREFQKYAYKKLNRNICYSEINKVACESDFWKGLNIKQRIDYTLEKSNEILKDLDVNPIVAACLASKETAYQSSTIRTKVACVQKGATPTAIGAFQINEFTLRDMINRGFFSLASAEWNKTPKGIIERFMPFLKKHLTEESYNLLTDASRSIRLPLLDGNGEKQYYDSRKTQLKTYADRPTREIYRLFTTNFELQVALFGIILKQKNYSISGYYGSEENADNKKYALHISNCIDCIHERIADREDTYHSCIALAKAASNYTMENKFKDLERTVETNRNEDCDQNNFDCLKNTCHRED